MNQIADLTNEQLVVGYCPAVKLSSPIDRLKQAADETTKWLGNTIQIHVSSPRSIGARQSLQEFVRTYNPNTTLSYLRLKGINSLVIHAPYVINLASPNEETWYNSLCVVYDEMIRAELMDTKNIVIHPGAYNTKGESPSNTHDGITRCAKAINEVMDALEETDVNLCIEMMSGKGTEICWNFEEMTELLQQIEPEFSNNIGVCLDTCHLHDAGYDIVTEEGFFELLDTIETTIGTEKVKVLHINDSKNPRYSHQDKHQSVGKGYIGMEPLRRITYCGCFGPDVPRIFETPNGWNMARLMQYISGEEGWIKGIYRDPHGNIIPVPM